MGRAVAVFAAVGQCEAFPAEAPGATAGERMLAAEMTSLEPEDEPVGVLE